MRTTTLDEINEGSPRPPRTGTPSRSFQSNHEAAIDRIHEGSGQTGS
jgi:hypothetical protein